MIRAVGFALLLLFVGCSTTPRITITGDASITGRNVHHLRHADRFEYRKAEDMEDVLGDVPPPPAIIEVIPGTPPTTGTTGTPGTPGLPGVSPTLPTPPGHHNPNIYNPLLSFLQRGPGGQQITVAHLQQITPAVMALVQFVQANPGVSLNQAAMSPQAGAFLSVAQGILQPLGLWNYNTLNQWANYVRYRLGSLRNILLSLYNHLQVPLSPGAPGTPGTPAVPGTPGTPGTSGTPGTPDQYIVHSVNPIAVINEVMQIYRSKDWLLFAERGPGLIHSLIRHAGFSRPRILLYGSRTRFYAPAVVTTRREDEGRVTYGLNQEGFFINEQTSGAGVFYQGADDISLVYALIEVKDRRARTLDVIASDRYALLKRAAGGDLDLLDRASTHSTGLLQVDAAFGEDHNYHLRVAGGSTPFASMGGVAGEIEYGEGVFTGRIGGGAFVEDGYSSGYEHLICYLELENTLRTPYLKVQDEESENAPEFRFWGSTTLAAAGMATRALNRIVKTNGRENRWNWGGQGDVRLVPELHASLDNEYSEISLYGGMTIGIVPHGHIDLDVPYQSLRPYPIRYHIGGEVRLKLNKIYACNRQDEHDAEVERGVKEWWTEEEKQAYRDEHKLLEVDQWLFLTFSGVGEVSDLFRKARFITTLQAYDFGISFLTEYEHYIDESLRDVRVGGGVAWRGLYLRGLSSIKDDDYRLQVGFEIEL